MKTVSFALIIFLFFTLTSCSQPQTPATWLQENTSELQTDDGFDFSPLKEVLKDKRIVALGESTHGLGSFYDLKSKIATYLHKELDFEVLAMEGGLGDIYLVYKSIDTLSPKQIRDNSVFGNFRANEIDPLFSHMEDVKDAKKPLLYVGFDTQTSTNYFYNTIQKYIREYNQSLADSIHKRMGSFQKSYAAGQNNDKEQFIHHRDIFINTSKELKELVRSNQAKIAKKYVLNELDFQVIYRTLDMFIASVNLSFEDKYLTYATRDELMFENLDWLLNEVYPNKKFVIWAHNGHVENIGSGANNIKWTGHYLKEKYKGDYFSIGLFAYQGESYQFWTRQNIPFHNQGANHIEQRFFNTGNKISYLTLENLENTPQTAWLFNEVNAYELENGGVVSFTPTNRFDAVISIAKGTPPTYN